LAHSLRRRARHLEPGNNVGDCQDGRIAAVPDDCRLIDSVVSVARGGGSGASPAAWTLDIPNGAAIITGVLHILGHLTISTKNH
jgi:hypothetical protein